MLPFLVGTAGLRFGRGRKGPKGSEGVGKNRLPLNQLLTVIIPHIFSDIGDGVYGGLPLTINNYSFRRSYVKVYPVCRHTPMENVVNLTRQMVLAQNSAPKWMVWCYG